ncbi:hypothetical protein M434DRAFT_322762 [Hypoxylon sp. CO27-5]|nr:hypothetical protein M434DRAFT_322762 [Hypoxylon sp. CO27-5]
MVGVFTKKNSKLKKHHIIRAAQICWQPFEVTFDSIIARLSIHKSVVREEIELLNTANLIKACQQGLESLSITRANRETLVTIQSDQKDLEEKIESATAKLKRAQDEEDRKLSEAIWEYHKQVEVMKKMLLETDFENKRNEILAFINPPEFMEDLEVSQDSRDEGTGLWLSNHPCLLEWLNTSDGSMLWISGSPGCGKTVLAGSIISDLPAEIPCKDSTLTYFFFRHNTPNKKTETSAYRAILAQIFHHASKSETLLNAFTYAMRGSSQRVASLNNLRDLLSRAANCIPNIYIIVDAVDECDCPDAFVDNLVRSNRGTSTKILLFSRPSIRSLQRVVREEHRITVTKSLNGADIYRYCADRIERLISADRLPVDVPPISEMAGWVANGADGMFLWARLMFIYLESEALAPPGRDRTVRLDAMRKLRYPDSLDNMYSRIIELIWSSHNYERELARQVFHWILCAKAQLSAYQLHDILECTYEQSEKAQPVVRRIGQSYLVPESFSAFSSMIILSCSSLVEIRRTSETVGAHYRFIHQSTAEFFLKRIYRSEHCHPGAIAFFSICEPEIEIRLATDCLNYLKHKVPGGPLSGHILQPAKVSAVKQAWPFFEYASLRWISHPESCLRCKHKTYISCVQSFLTSVSSFVSDRLALMTWIESLYLFSNTTLIKARVDSLKL